MFKLISNKNIKNISNMCNFKELKKEGLKVFGKKKFNKFLYQYGKTRVLDGYADVLKVDNRFMKKVSTNQIIKLVNFDHFLGNYVLSYLLDFEQRFNTVLINTIIKEYNLSQEYILEQNNCPWLVFKNFEERTDFFSTIYQRVDSSNFLRKYEDKKNIPLVLLSMSWTFFNIITFFEAVDISVQTKVIQGLGLENWNIDVFKSMLHIIRRLRNTISHNDFLIVSKFEIYRTLIKKARLKEDKNFFYIYDVCKLLDIVYPTKKGLTITLIKLVKKQHFSSTVKNKVIELLGVEFEEKNNQESENKQENNNSQDKKFKYSNKQKQNKNFNNYKHYKKHHDKTNNHNHQHADKHVEKHHNNSNGDLIENKKENNNINQNKN